MPEMKRTFQAGMMDRNDDERIVRSGRYRDALNVNVGRSDSSDVGALENVPGNILIDSGNYMEDGVCIGSHLDAANDRVYFFVTTNNSETEDNEGQHGVYVYSQITGQVNLLATGEWLNFHQSYLITGINFIDELLFWTDDRNEPRKINVTRAINNPDYYNNDFKGSVIKFSPIAPPRITNIARTGNSSNFLQDKFVRFGYRYKFDDGEYSCISPISPVCFRSITEKTLTTTDYLAGSIAEFVNEAKQIFIEVDVPVNRGITAVEILYNESSNTNMYILEELAAETESLADDPIVVSYTYDSQDPFRAIPGSQITRVYDAVPRKAKAQELAGGRIIYGNYLQNYNLPSISFQVEAQSVADDESNPFNRYSVKSRRTYQVGLVLSDKFGRLSPVILSSTGGDTIFVDPESGTDAMQQLAITINNPDAIPDWAVSYRIVVKNRVQEYYNFFFNELTGTNDFLISGGNINKVPRDTTDETVFAGSVAVAQSVVKLYPKYQNGSNSTSTNVLNVDSIKYGGAGDDGFPDATIYNSGFTAAGGPGVFETEPRESQLDIFYETATAGLVSTITDEAIPIDYYNCYILNIGGQNAHLELNRIRAEYNAQWFPLGIKAYAVQDNFAEQRRFNTLIHSSSFFNSRVGLNNINQFNEAEGGLTVSLDPADGSIQKLFAEDTQVIIFQEDKVSRSPVDKDFIYSAEGGAVPVTSSTAYLGTIAAYAGEYGISKNPESFAVYGTRKYFTDKTRGVAMMLGGNGLTEVSERGMTDFFRDALALSTQVIGSFDEYYDQYNVTINGNPAYGGQEDTNIATGKDGYFTVSYEEERQGWVSFKSFQQEGGVTLNNRYYTLNGGKLWEHNHRNAKYNNFYDTQHTSYVEVIFNDSPSDVKEFKTVNYEGTKGWECNLVATDYIDYALNPDDGALDEIVTGTLAIQGGVSDGSLTQVESQTVVKGTEFKWVIKVSPATSDFVFGVDHSVTVEFDGEEINGLLGEDGNLYFITDTITADEDRTFNVVVDGAAARDTSGAILIIRVINDTGDDDIVTFIPDFNEFRGGPNVFEYVSGAENPEVNLEAEVTEDSDFEFAEDSLTFTYSDNIADLRDGEEIINFSKQRIRYEQKITLPSIQTNGTITIGTDDDNTLLRLKPGASVAPFILDGDSGTYSIKQLIDGVLFDFVSTSPIQRVFSESTVSWDNFYIVPNWDDDDVTMSYVIAMDGDVVLPVNGNLTTYTAERVDDHELAELIGAYQLNLVTVELEQTENRFDESKDIVVTGTTDVTTRLVDQWTYTLVNDGDEIFNEVLIIDPTDVGVVTIENTDFKDAEYTITGDDADEAAKITWDNEDFQAGTTSTLSVESDIAQGDYTLTITPQNKEGYRSPEEFTDIEITIQII